MTIASQDSGLFLIMEEGFGYWGSLEWREKDSLQVKDSSLFTRYADQCLDLSGLCNGCRIHFQRDSTGKVMSLQVPGKWYGLVWEKQTE